MITKINIRPELTYECPYCRNLFDRKKDIVYHLKTEICPDKPWGLKVRIQFLKPL